MNQSSILAHMGTAFAPVFGATLSISGTCACLQQHLKKRRECRYDCERVSATDLVFVLRSEQALDPTGVEDDPALLRVALPNPSGHRKVNEILSRDLVNPDKTFAKICASAGWDPHYCMTDLLKLSKPDLEKARKGLGAVFAAPAKGAWGFEQHELQLGPRRFVVCISWRMSKVDVRRFVLSAVRGFRPNTRTTLVLVCLPEDVRGLHELAVELGPLTSGVKGAEVNLHIFPCTGKISNDEVGFVAFFRYRCLAKVMSLRGGSMAGSALDIVPFDEVLLSDVRDVRTSVRVCSSATLCSRTHANVVLAYPMPVSLSVVGMVPKRPV